MIGNRGANLYKALFAALAASIFLHFVMFAFIFFGVNESSFVARVIDAMLTPAGCIVDDILPGHSLVQIFYSYVISVVMYALAFWPVVAVLILRRHRE